MSNIVPAYSYDAASVNAIESAKSVEAAKAAAKGSPITALAIVLASVATKMTDNLMELATQISAVKDQKAAITAGGGTPGDMNETVLTAMLQADTQKMSMFMQAMNNAIKSLGEAETTVARKG